MPLFLGSVFHPGECEFGMILHDSLHFMYMHEVRTSAIMLNSKDDSFYILNVPRTK